MTPLSHHLPRDTHVQGNLTSPEEATVLLFGRIDRHAALEASGMIRGLIATGARRVTVNLAGAHDVDTQLLTILARLHDQLTDLSGPDSPAGLWVTGAVVPELMPAMRDAELDEAFVVYKAVRRGA